VALCSGALVVWLPLRLFVCLFVGFFCQVVGAVFLRLCVSAFGGDTQ
jgi:hypothetical protein